MNENGNSIDTQRQSRAGIASAIVAALSMFCFCLYVAVFAYISTSGPRPMDTTDKLFTLLNFFMAAAILGGLAAGFIGLVSLFQKNQKKTFGIAGLFLTVVILCSSCGFYLWALLTPK